MKNYLAAAQVAGVADELSMDTLQNLEVNQIVEYPLSL